MKKTALLYLVAVMLTGIMPFCSKKSSGPCSETAMQVTTTPAINSTEAPAPGPDFPLHIAITSGMPAAGVTIEVKARPESSSTPFFSETRNSTSSNNDFTITGTTSQVPSIVEITITSKSCNTNKFTGSFKYSRK